MKKTKKTKIELGKAIVMRCANEVPTTWLDNLLTGKEAVIGQPPYNCKDIQNLLLAVKKRIEAVKA